MNKLLILLCLLLPACKHTDPIEGFKCPEGEVMHQIPQFMISGGVPIMYGFAPVCGKADAS